MTLSLPSTGTLKDLHLQVSQRLSVPSVSLVFNNQTLRIDDEHRSITLKEVGFSSDHLQLIESYPLTRKLQLFIQSSSRSAGNTVEERSGETISISFRPSSVLCSVQMGIHSAGQRTVGEDLSDLSTGDEMPRDSLRVRRREAASPRHAQWLRDERRRYSRCISSIELISRYLFFFFFLYNVESLWNKSQSLFASSEVARRQCGIEHPTRSSLSLIRFPSMSAIDILLFSLKIFTLSMANPLDLVEPIDYEEYLDEHREKIENDPLRHLLEYPPDDIDFIRIDRQYRTIIPVMPEKEFEHPHTSLSPRHLLPPRALTDPHIRDCLQSFNGEHFYLHRKYVVVDRWNSRLTSPLQLCSLRQCNDAVECSSRTTPSFKTHLQTRLWNRSDRWQSTDSHRTRKSWVEDGRLSRSTTVCL